MSAELPISAESAEWLRQALRDTFNADFMGDYQREVVGEVPADVCDWASIDPDLFSGDGLSAEELDEDDA